MELPCSLEIIFPQEYIFRNTTGFILDSMNEVSIDLSTNTARCSNIFHFPVVIAFYGIMAPSSIDTWAINATLSYLKLTY